MVEATPFDPKVFRRKRPSASACMLGMGRSGIAAANLLAKNGFKVFVSDIRPRKEVKASAQKLHPKIQWEAGGHGNRVLRCDFAVKSPGIPSHSPILGQLCQARIPVFSELEVALAFCRSPQVVAITGTNGKSTTSYLVAAIFKAARKKVHLAGNVGLPLTAVARKIKAKDNVILEVSSYQLEDSRYFRPRAAAITNITADHVDHHGNMSRYIAAKARIFHNQEHSDVCVFNADDPISVKLSRQCPARKLFFSHEPSALSHAWIQSGRIHIKHPGLGKNGKKPKEIRLIPPSLPGIHNLENAMAAALIATDCGIPAAVIGKAFKSFKGVEHRIEACGTVKGIVCINDSKATNVESTLTALKALPTDRQHILLILGGLHKGYPYTPLRSQLQANVKGILTIGSAANKIEEDLSGIVPIFPCKTLSEAVKTAFHIGHSGDTLLLSPACASFDQFQDFEHRGRCFKALINKIKRDPRP